MNINPTVTAPEDATERGYREAAAAITARPSAADEILTRFANGPKTLLEMGRCRAARAFKLGLLKGQQELEELAGRAGGNFAEVARRLLNEPARAPGLDLLEAGRRAAAERAIADFQKGYERELFWSKALPGLASVMAAAAMESAPASAYEQGTRVARTAASGQKGRS